MTEKVAVVTGSSRGIGRAIALRLGRSGVRVVVNYLEHEGAAQEVVQEIAAAGSEALAFRADVRKGPDVTALMSAAMERFGRLDILVNNAGITRDRTLGKMEEGTWNDVLDTNLGGVYRCCRAAIALMPREGPGWIVNVASVIAHTGGFGQTNYAAAKAGILGLTRSLALELASRGITVNAVAPGFINTDMVKAVPPAVLEKIIGLIPLRRLGDPDDIASAVHFLVESGGYVTGSCLNVNGGMYLG